MCTRSSLLKSTPEQLSPCLSWNVADWIKVRHKAAFRSPYSNYADTTGDSGNSILLRVSSQFLSHAPQILFDLGLEEANSFTVLRSASDQQRNVAMHWFQDQAEAKAWLLREKPDIIFVMTR